MRAELALTGCFLAVALCGQETIGSISGVVTDETDMPIPGVGVILKTDSAVGLSRTTQTDGRYRFERLRDGNYQLEFQAAGFAIGRISLFAIGSSETKIIPTIALGVSSCASPPSVAPNHRLSTSPELSGVSGAISDSKGRGIAKVAIQIARVDGKADTLARTSDDRGGFAFSNLQSGEYRLTAKRRSYYP